MTRRQSEPADPIPASEADIRDVANRIESLRRGSSSRRATSAVDADPATRTSAQADQVANEIARLGKLRVFRGRNVSIRDCIEQSQTRAAKTQRQLGALVDLWVMYVPRDIVARSAVTGFRGGVLQIKVDSAAVSYDLDRRLREGLLAELRKNFSGTLSRVKITLGAHA